MKTVKIPDEIHALYLPVAEKIALARIHERPRISTRRLAKELGIGERGIEKMLHRLRSQKLVRAEGTGRGRLLHLTFAIRNEVEESSGETTCSDARTPGGDAVPVTTELPVVREPERTAQERALAAVEDYLAIGRTISEMVKKPWMNGTLRLLVDRLSDALSRIERDVDEPYRSQLLREGLPARNALGSLVFAFQTGLRGKALERIDCALATASHEQLARLFGRIQEVRALDSGNIEVFGLLEDGTSSSPKSATTKAKK